MTALGETTMQGKEKPIADEFQDAARAWFTDNMLANKYEIELVGKMIEDKTGIKLDEKSILDLLKFPS